jgi:uncharacterized coiled-coil protein SlyX
MSLKEDNQALREQVARLTERLKTDGDAATLQATIRSMQTTAAAQQEEIEHLRLFKRTHENKVEKEISAAKQELSTDTKDTIKELNAQITEQKQIIETLRADNTRLVNRLTEIAKGATL